jgi:hypothetical protein
LRRAGLVLALGAAVAAALPASAGAGASANIRRSPGDSGAFTLQASNGYSLYFKSEKRILTVVASRQRPGQPTISPRGRLLPARPGAGSESTYVVRGLSRDPSVIEADLGPAGLVSLVFQPSGEKKVTHVDLDSKSEKCTGATRVTRRLGSFVGTVSFRGENGYTSAEATTVPGTVGTSAFRNCTTLRRPGQPPARKPAPPTPQDAIFSVSGEASFAANRDREDAFFYAFDAAELAPGFFVVRSATARGGAGLFALGRDGLGATLSPPAPFSGSGVYRDPAGGPPSWGGNLSVEYPGVIQPLTGPGMTDPRLRLLG